MPLVAVGQNVHVVVEKAFVQIQKVQGVMLNAQMLVPPNPNQPNLQAMKQFLLQTPKNVRLVVVSGAPDAEGFVLAVPLKPAIKHSLKSVESLLKLALTI